MYHKYLIWIILLLNVVFGIYGRIAVTGANEETRAVKGSNSTSGEISRPSRSTVPDEEIERINNCKCVKFFQCNEDNYVITDGVTLIDERNSFKIHKLICSDDESGTARYCCYLRQPSLVPSDLTFGQTLLNNRVTNKKCGERHENYNSQNLQAGDYPWMAAIYVKSHLVCTGTLIHTNVVLTAAHYVLRVKDKSNIRVMVNGEIELSNETTNGEKRVVEIIPHPKYVPDGLLYYDIALLILNEPYEINNLVNTICIPLPDASFENLRCRTAGWNRKDPKYLHSIEVPFFGHDQCQHQLRTYTELGPKFNLHDSFICAGGEKGIDVCKGDGGSPLMCESDGVQFQVGIVSWGKGCNEENVPGVYTNVGKFRHWIVDELFKRGIILI